MKVIPHVVKIVVTGQSFEGSNEQRYICLEGSVDAQKIRVNKAEWPNLDSFQGKEVIAYQCKGRWVGVDMKDCDGDQVKFRNLAGVSFSELLDLGLVPA